MLSRGKVRAWMGDCFSPRAMQTISAITMDASSGAHQTAQIIQGMLTLSEKLNQSISQFKIEREAAGRFISHQIAAIGTESIASRFLKPGAIEI